MTFEHLPVLYSFRRCPYAMRARLALSVSQQSCVLREIDLKNRPDQLYEASPKGTVPVLVFPGGEVLEESLEIMHWALGQQDPESWLAPFEATADEARSLLEECDGDFKFHLDRYKYAQRYEEVNPENHRSKASSFLHRLNRMLTPNPFLFGLQASMVDMAVAPFVRQFAFADIDWFKAQDWEPLTSWLECFLDSARFRSVMRKYSVWNPDEPELVLDWSN